MDIIARIKELNRRVHFSGPRSVLDETGLIEDRAQKPEPVLDETGLIEDIKPDPKERGRNASKT